MIEVDESRAAKVLETFLSQVRLGVGVPAVSAGIVRSGKRITACVGQADSSRCWPVTSTARYGIACITKLLVAMVAVTLADQRVLELDEPIDPLLARFYGISGPAGGITLRNLLTHTGGFQGPLMFGVTHRKFNWPEFSMQFGNFNQVFSPGTVFNYENTGHVVVGQIIEGVTGVSIEELLHQYIFSPLGITPGKPLEDYKRKNNYVAPHRMDNRVAKIVAPSVFGPFWKASLADLTLSIDDLLTIGAAVVGDHRYVDFTSVRSGLVHRVIELPRCVSGKSREHTPAFFNTVCAEYDHGWFGYAGSANGQTCGLRFDLKTKSVCATALNAWLPIARDAVLDRLTNVKTHPDAGTAGGNVGLSPQELTGRYVGGGNIMRSITVSAPSDDEVQLEFGSDGVPGPTMRLCVDEQLNLVPDPEAMSPNIGFFVEPATGTPCIMVGVASLKKVA